MSHCNTNVLNVSLNNTSLCLYFQVLHEVFKKEKLDSYIVGEDVCGVVTQVGVNVTTIQEGDAVVGKCYGLNTVTQFATKCRVKTELFALSEYSIY